jgi:hypothetical protein
MFVCFLFGAGGSFYKVRVGTLSWCSYVGNLLIERLVVLCLAGTVNYSLLVDKRKYKSFSQCQNVCVLHLCRVLACGTRFAGRYGRSRVVFVDTHAVMWYVQGLIVCRVIPKL